MPLAEKKLKDYTNQRESVLHVKNTDSSTPVISFVTM